MKLVTEPTGEVTVTVSGHAGTDLTLDKTTLTFTVDNWATAQTVTVEAGQDADGANDTATLTHTASGGDYASITADLAVTVTDDDAADIALSETGLTVTEGDAAGSSYTVRLATEPTGSVNVTISGHDGTDLTLDKTTLTFTVDNWGTAQTVTVEAGQDDDGSNGHRDADAHRLGRGLRQHNEGPAGDGHRHRHGGHRAQRDGPHRDGGRRRGVDLHSEAGHPALRRRHCHCLRTRRHGPESGQDEPDLHGGRLGHGADGDGQGGQGRQRGQRHRRADPHRLGRRLRRHNR